MRKLMALVMLGLLAGCGAKEAPRHVANACLLVKEKPGYMRAMKATERRWGVPVHVQMATIRQESSFISNARPPRKYILGIIPNGRISSAYGYSQALDGTWEEYQQKTGRWMARRTNIKDATDFMGWYMDGTTRSLGISKADARGQYLAYHEGRGGYARGSHNGKPWLLKVAQKVERNSQTYKAQLNACGRR